ncbi:MAG: T9SS type A sorting domain-containing protein [Saprospiraceae bacterium]|nr:MAG: T9SS type A sorting domain-containing protein [Saprospiraceae bacterium]
MAVWRSREHSFVKPHIQNPFFMQQTQFNSLTMKRLNILLTLFIAFIGYAASAQVNFNLTYNQSTERYTVSLVPQTTYLNPQNITGTGQVTIKVPSNAFDPVDIENLLEGMVWEANSRNNSPEEAPDYDYISFGLIIQGVAYPNYQEGVELPLFSFRNAFGCTGKVFLVNNGQDPFMPPNSASANVGNTITILGAGGDAYAGNLHGGIVDCSEDGTATATEEELSLQGFQLFPNPVVEFLNLNIGWAGKTTDGILQIVDAAGRKMMAQPISIVNGENHQRLEVSQLAPGTYWLQVQGEGWKLNFDSFTKQ